MNLFTVKVMQWELARVGVGDGPFSGLSGPSVFSGYSRFYILFSLCFFPSGLPGSFGWSGFSGDLKIFEKIKRATISAIRWEVEL